MRLLVVTQYFWPENFRINELVCELVARGHSVTVLTGYPNYPSGKVFEEFARHPDLYNEFMGADIVRAPVIPRFNNPIGLLLNYISFSISATFIGLCRLHNKPFDLIFVYEPSPITVGLPAIALGRVKNAPIFFWVLDLWPETLEAVGALKSKFFIKIIGRLVSHIYKRCDVILAQSKAFIPKIRPYCKKGQDIRYFPGWCENVFYEGQEQGCAPELQSLLGEFNIIFAGNVGVAQDFPAIIAAADSLREHKQIRWFVVGDGRMLNWLKREVSLRGLDHTFFIMGKYPIDRMPSFFRCADALLIALKNSPIFSLTIPAKLQSYLAAGVPILAMVSGESSRIVVESNSGLVINSGDFHSLAQSVLALSKMNTIERKLFGDNGKQYAAMNFDRDILISRLEKWMRASVNSNES
jgi:colanic acid biosynthesis glycosyl transferase WcaI